MSGVTFGVLGPLEAVRDGRPLDLGPPRQRRLLAVLLARANRSVSPDVLADVLWGDQPPASARNIVHGYISSLRRALEPERTSRDPGTLLRSEPAGYVLCVDPVQVDAGRFSQLVEEGWQLVTSDPGAAARVLGEALALWRGQAYTDASDEPVAQAEAVRLEEIRLAALDSQAEAEMALGRHAALVPGLRALVEEHPLRERLWALLMLALYRSGRQSEALVAYASACEELRTQLGVEPAAELRALHAAILAHDPSLRPPSVRTNLPVPTSSFVGRDAELAETREMLGGTRLLTLTGAGGCGKTRLALHLAHEVLDAYPDGVWWVDLAPVGDGDLVASVVASVLERRAAAGEGIVDALVDALRESRTLLLLDNCEHVVGPCASLVFSVLRSCPDVSIIATSREPLGVEGEAAYRVPSLPFPERGQQAEPRYAAVRLFCDRARGVEPSFRLTDANADAVAAICRELDGIPLAIELAAARTCVLSPAEIAEELADRFSLLRGGARTALPRHRTLEASVEWSYRLLAAPDRVLLNRLSVFAGTFDLDAMREVCAAGDVLEPLSSLVEKSLVQVEGAEGRTRYRLLETIRQYASRMLHEAGETPDVRARHLDHYLALAERREAATGTILGPLLDRLGPEVDNLRAAMDWGMSSAETEKTLRLAAGASLLWLVRGHWSELLRWLEPATEAPGVDPDVRAKALVAAAAMAGQWDFRAMRVFAERAVELARGTGNQSRLARALASLGYAEVCTWHEGGRAHLEEAVAIAEEAGDTGSRVPAFAALASIETDSDAAHSFGAQAIEAARESGNQVALLLALAHVARNVVLFGDGKAVEACALFEEVLARARPLEEMAMLTVALSAYVYAEVLRGRYDRARELADESWAAAEKSCMRPALANTLQSTGFLSYAIGDLEEARDELQRARDLWRETGERSQEAICEMGTGAVALQRGDLDEARSILRGVADTAVNAAAWWPRARALVGLSRLARLEGDHRLARDLVRQAVEVMARRGDRAGLADAFETAAACSASPAEAARMFGTAHRLREDTGYRRFPVEQAAYDADVAATRRAMGAEPFATAFADGEAMSVEQATDICRAARLSS